MVTPEMLVAVVSEVCVGKAAELLRARLRVSASERGVLVGKVSGVVLSTGTPVIRKIINTMPPSCHIPTWMRATWYTYYSAIYSHTLTHSIISTP